MDTTTSPEPQIDESARMSKGGAEHQAHESHKPNTVAVILGWLFAVIAVMTAMALGLWSYQLNSRLALTRDQLASLQADYNQLKSDHANLASERTQTNATLENTKAELAKAYADLNTANSALAAQKAQVGTARKLIAIVEATLTSGEDPTGVQANIYNSGDDQLINLWETVLQRPNEQNLLAFYRYLFGAIGAALG